MLPVLARKENAYSPWLRTLSAGHRLPLVVVTAAFLLAGKGVNMTEAAPHCAVAKPLERFVIDVTDKQQASLPVAGGAAWTMCSRHDFSIGERHFLALEVPASESSAFERMAIAVGHALVERDVERHSADVPDDPLYKGSGLWSQDFDNQWAIKRIGFGKAIGNQWLGTAALQPVSVAVIDTGVDWLHPDLPESAFWRNVKEVPDNGADDDANGYVDDMIGWNFVDRDNKPWDHDGHGTFVTGVIAAAANNGVGIAGIDPGAKIMVLKALDAFGRGHASMVAEALSYAADNGAQVINLSLGGPRLTQIEQLAVDYARSRHAIVVVAAGNDGAEVGDFSPAGLDGVITVAATDRGDRRAGFSNWGPLVDIAAPGVDVLSLRARKTDLLSLIPNVEYETGKGIVGDDRAYYRASGTSFAAPMVTGTISLILSRGPSLSGEQARRMVLNSARDIETPGFDNYTGYGLLDAAAALKANPDYFLESRISGVEVGKKAGKLVLRVSGTVNADAFSKATLYLGSGADPQKWSRISLPISKPVTNATLMELPASLFKGAKQWTIRLVTEHANGSTREARFKLTLG